MNKEKISGFETLFKLFINVNLSASKISKQTCGTIARSINTFSIVNALNLSNNPIGVDGSKKLSNLNLKYLNLSKCQLGVGGAQAIANIISKSSIETLICSSNKINVEGARFIGKAIEESKTLQIFDISSNLIRDKGMKAITEGLFENHSIKVISVKNNGLKDDGFNLFIKTYMGHPGTQLSTALFSSNDTSIYTLKLTEQLFI